MAQNRINDVRLIECKKATEIPTTPMWCYGRGGVKCLDDALAMHIGKGRQVPEVVYLLKGEYYFPVGSDLIAWW